MTLQSVQIGVENTARYHSIFNYKLTHLETYRYLIGDQFNKELVYSAIDNQPDSSSLDHDASKVRRQKAWQLITKSQLVFDKLVRRFPFIMVAAASGSVGALDAKTNSDIDIFVICAPQTQWLTRACLLLYFRIVNQLVNTKLKDNMNYGRFCFNLIIENSRTDLLQKEQDLYTAMEIAHLKVIFNRDNTFQRFIHQNTWIADFLPNWWTIFKTEWAIDDTSTPSNYHPSILTIAINTILRLTQQLYYVLRHKRKLSTRNFLHDYRKEILAKYDEISVK